MNKLIVGLTAIVLSTSQLGVALAADKKVPCADSQDVSSIAAEIPKYFKKIRPDTYLIENVPESKNGHGLGGQLTVFIPYTDRNTLSIFDRTDSNPSNWYNVSNWQYGSQGCVDNGVYVGGKNRATYLSGADSQSKFNAFVQKVKDIIKHKK